MKTRHHQEIKDGDRSELFFENVGLSQLDEIYNSYFK